MAAALMRAYSISLHIISNSMSYRTLLWNVLL